MLCLGICDNICFYLIQGASLSLQSSSFSQLGTGSDSFRAIRSTLWLYQAEPSIFSTEFHFPATVLLTSLLNSSEPQTKETVIWNPASTCVQDDRGSAAVPIKAQIDHLADNWVIPSLMFRNTYIGSKRKQLHLDITNLQRGIRMPRSTWNGIMQREKYWSSFGHSFLLLLVWECVQGPRQQRF